jgi:hypothetical protein
MIYFLREKPIEDKDSEWEILEHFNMSVIATVYNEKDAQHIIDLLNNEQQQVLNKYNLERFDPII